MRPASALMMAHNRGARQAALCLYPATMNLSLQFHDSEVRDVQATGEGLIVAFSAAAVRSSDRRNGADGYVMNLEMLLTRATWSGAPADGVGRLSTGVLSIDDVPISPLPLPFARDGQVEVRLNFANGTLLSIAAAAVALRFSGEPRWVESYAC